ncbi:ATP-dependent DNA helicase RecG [Methylotuvimicrobium alcaliphilum]|uniref:ATP-dependent DNA helicase RecG n=1 Tax=Methylotuvimicrobium alcaliphilum (strain DSM 19304 / NCIMB 14124 / VKM B-2133 / 20Z) TaxID=1091494 RepID=G4SVX6_META2|nr:ATP-dependent DNA helicase RecG [Methylotuvimicrobium alcaliphilum]CCE25211.1 ATP-dependent DNA helicase recG [Methylotuvimicrobium alcaliphilum 20Z]
MDRNDPLDQSVASLGGIGKQTASKLEKLGIRNCQDLIFHLPHRYEDRTRTQAIGALKPGMTALIKGKVELTDTLLRGRKSLICRIGDGTGFISLRFFHFSAAQLTQLSPGTYLSCFAEVRHGYAGLEMIHPDYKILNNPEQTVTEDTLTPVYPLTEGLSQSLLRKAIKQTLNLHLKHLTDWLPESLLQRFHYPTLIEAINFLHAPSEQMTAETLLQNDNPARKRLAFEELLSHHLSLRVVREQARAQPAPPFTIDEITRRHFLKSLPFQLTGAQQRVITEIEADCSQQQPMLRLVQGDVGSGKTVVSAYAALLALATGYQVAVMAPTELLAEQHFRNFSAWFDSFQTQIIFLTGQIKGNTRKAALESLEDGSAGIVIGTHALFQESVTFKKLGLIVIDEQHRFGVHQRMALRDKGRNAGIRPHQLVMTATPIPRTLAMLQYSDLDISIIDELPPGRKPIVTSVIPSERREEVIARIGHWVAQKRQAYWVCTLIEESEALQCEAAEKTAELLTQVLPDIRIALVHGRMKAADKDAVMQDFKNHRIDLLVATTVIEVGVDVPNAGLMIIENPERLGLSQLHQLRGRVGRGKDDSYCLLLYQSPLSDTARHRLGILRDTNDGFMIAEKDLELRGPGEVMGTRQTGQMQFKIADLDRDTDLLDNIPTIAESLLHHSPDAVQPLIKRWLGETVNYAEV